MESNTWCPRLTAWITLSGSAVYVKGFGSALCSTTKRLIGACKSTTDRKMPRLMGRQLGLAGFSVVVCPRFLAAPVGASSALGPHRRQSKACPPSPIQIC